MKSKIKNKLNAELKQQIGRLERDYSLNRLSPVLAKSIREFLLRKGKRLRPLLFVLGYLGFAKKEAPNLYRSALSFELLHGFFLVHDDIVDKSPTRRGKPAMHKILGEDLALIAADLIYALAMESFLSVKENSRRKEKALRIFIRAAAHTATGEFIELLSSSKDIGKIKKQDISRIHDLKTACYSFASPLSCGATLAGANQKQTDLLYQYGIYLGRAFQLKDDILGLFGEEKKTGKPSLTDLEEAKKTLLSWYAYHNSRPKERALIRKILNKNKVKRSDLLTMRRIMVSSGALYYSAREISRLTKEAQSVIASCRMDKKYKAMLNNYSKELLSL